MSVPWGWSFWVADNSHCCCHLGRVNSRWNLLSQNVGYYQHLWKIYRTVSAWWCNYNPTITHYIHIHINDYLYSDFGNWNDVFYAVFHSFRIWIWLKEVGVVGIVSFYLLSEVYNNCCLLEIDPLVFVAVNVLSCCLLLYSDTCKINFVFHTVDGLFNPKTPVLL